MSLIALLPHIIYDSLDGIANRALHQASLELRGVWLLAKDWLASPLASQVPRVLRRSWMRRAIEQDAH